LNVPNSAASGVSFQPPRFANPSSLEYYYDDNLNESGTLPQSVSLGADLSKHIPMTASLDGPDQRLARQQTSASRGMNPNCAPFSPAYNVNVQSPSPYMQAQALQLQLMQLEIMRLQVCTCVPVRHFAFLSAFFYTSPQTIQAQQYQAELITQAQLQQAHTQSRRGSINPPASAGPLSTGFDLRSATLRRVNQAEQLKLQLGVNDDQVPMTSAIDGKFGNRTTSITANGSIARFPGDDIDDAAQANQGGMSRQTTVISGGTPLGASTSTSASNLSSGSNTPPSKSDSAVSWRRGGANNSVLGGNRSTNSSGSPSLKITPPPSEHTVLPTSASATKARPMPLRFNLAASQSLPSVTIDTADCVDAGEDSEGTSSATSSNGSFKSGESEESPTTPPSSSSSNDVPLSPREEATKRLYAGLGIGRPAPSEISTPAPAVLSHRMASQPLRQPRGPPSGADEIGSKNFATRIRRKAIGGELLCMRALLS
jgi:hypothetical protein